MSGGGMSSIAGFACGAVAITLLASGCQGSPSADDATQSSSRPVVASAAPPTPQAQLEDVLRTVMGAYASGDQAAVLKNSMGTVYRQVVNETPAAFRASAMSDQQARGALSDVKFANYFEKDNVGIIEITTSYAKIPRPQTSTAYAYRRDGWKIIEIDPNEA